MPKYDIVCPSCGWEAENQYLAAGAHPACPACATTTEYVWQTSMPSILRDEIPGGMTIENGFPQPRTFYSQSEYRRAVKEAGLVNKVRHVGVNGTDKSPHTTRWI